MARGVLMGHTEHALRKRRSADFEGLAEEREISVVVHAARAESGDLGNRFTLSFPQPRNAAVLCFVVTNREFCREA